MSDYIAPVDYDGKEVNAFTTKEDIESLEEVVAAALTDLDSRLPQKYWGQQLPEGGAEITGDMSGVTSIRLPAGGGANNDAWRYVMDVNNDDMTFRIRLESNDYDYPDTEVVIGGQDGSVKMFGLTTRKVIRYGNVISAETNELFIYANAPTFIEFQITGQCSFSLVTEGGDDIENEDIIEHYYWTFDTGNAAPTITWPSLITSWYGGSVPTIQANKHYEVSVLGRRSGQSFVAVIMEV